MVTTDSTSDRGDSDQTAAAREAADQAIVQAREAASATINSLKTLDTLRLAYLGSLAAVVVLTLVFDMTSFSIGLDSAVSETVAQAQRDLQARMNSWSYSAFTSTIWGKLAWATAATGVGLVIWCVSTRTRAAWVPLAEIGCAVACTLLLALMFFVSFPDLSAYSDASCSATLFGYWLPLAAAGTASTASVRRLLS